MSKDRQIDKIRSAAAQAAALAEARKDIKRTNYGAHDRRPPGKSDISLGWRQTDRASDR